MDALIRRLLSVSWASGTAGASVTPCSGGCAAGVGREYVHEKHGRTIS